jgi:large subunit ribosomal protein L28
MPKDAVIPEYPYGDSLLFKQSNKGLYGGQRIQFGNNVSKDTETKTRRHWKPNIVTKGLYSVILKKRIRLRLTSRVLKTMDREGGLDNYLLKESEQRIKELGPLGWALRWRLMQTRKVKAQFRAEAAELGIPQEVIDQQWPERQRKPRLSRTEKRRLRKEAAEAERLAAEAAEEAPEEEAEDVPVEPEPIQTLKLSPRDKYHRIHFHKNQILKKRLAPSEKIAEKMALAELEKEKKRYALFESKDAIVEFEKARKRELSLLRKLGREQLNEAGLAKLYAPGSSRSRELEWLARRKAEAIIEQKRQELYGDLDGSSPTEEEPASVPRQIVEEEKDWADLAKQQNATV